jgi:GTP-binding protein Era
MVWNKIDLLDKEGRRRLKEKLAALPADRAFAISALTGEGVAPLLTLLRGLMPEGQPLYDPESLSDRDLRFLAGEIVREKVFEIMREEVPYSVAARVEEYQERERGAHYVRAIIYVEHESQKGMVIGRGGAMLRDIGKAARPEIEELAQAPVFLDLHVKVRKNWTKHPQDLQDFGYDLPKRPRSGARKRRL